MATTENEFFSFEIGDKKYTMPLKTDEVMTPRWVRLHRHLDEMDYMMTLLEDLSGASDEALSEEQRQASLDILEALDSSSWPDHKRVQRELVKHLRATQGE